MSNLIVSHRVQLTWIIAPGYLLLLLVTQSAHEGNLISALLFFCGLILVITATAGRMWCGLYISGYKNRELVVVGPYSMMRHPLYFFSLLGFAGVGFATGTVSIGLGNMLAFAATYPFVIRHEEERLRAAFGQTFTEYCRRTPRFWPNPRLLREPETYVVKPRVIRTAARDALGFLGMIGLTRLIGVLHQHHVIEPLLRLP